MFKTLLSFRPRMRSEWLSILTAVYLLFFMNGTFWDKSSVFLKGDVLALLALGIGLLAGFIALTVTFSAKYVIKPVLIFIVLASVSGAWFMDRFGVIIDGEMIGPEPIRRDAPKIGRNDPCTCGSGRKYKKCCGARETGT